MRSKPNARLAGVFNHMGETSGFFTERAARSRQQIPRPVLFRRTVFYGYRCWAGAGNLPALTLENPTNDRNQDVNWVRKLIAIRKQHPALRYGDFTALDSDALLAFTRTTGRLRDTVLVAVNPTDPKRTEVFPTRVGRLMSWGEMEDVLTGERLRSIEGLITLEASARSIRVFVPITTPANGYSPYNRIP